MIMYGRVQMKRPTVVRKGSKVITCHLYRELKQCMGPQCFWNKVGDCKFHDKLYGRKRAK